MRHRPLNRAVNRRDLLIAAGVTFAGTLGAGCDAMSTAPDTDGRSEPGGTDDMEAPELAERVRAGELPAVSERLPERPMVIEAAEIGSYGGEWRNALLGTANSPYIYCLAGYENLVRWSPGWTGAAGATEVEPNVAEKFDVNDDGTRFTFRLRQGMKWSDGEPFTADDVMFAIEDVLLNSDLTPVAPGWLTSSSGNVATIEKPDDYTVVITFDEPAGLFLQNLATPGSHVLTHFPKHYLEQFHPRYNPEVEKTAEDEGFSDWMSYFSSKGAGWNWGTNPDQPTLAAWALTTPFGDGTRVVLDRNPYYWKVDHEGRQLPYLDRVVFEVVQDSEVLLLMATRGDINLEAGPDTRFTSLKNKPVLAQGREDANYEFLDVRSSFMNIMVISLNLANENSAHREMFTQKDFRIGLSHAIDRSELIATAMQGQGEPYQAAPLPDSPLYDEELATQYLNYDVELANQHLDQAGYTDRNSDGIRLGPDGEPIVITIGLVPEFQPEWVDMLELVKDYWAEVGIQLNLRPEGRSLSTERTEANQHDATVWTGAGGLDVFLDPRYYFPFNNGSHFGMPWMSWFGSAGEEGEEPPAATRRQMELYDKIRATPDPDEQEELMGQILEIAKKEFYVIGTARRTQEYFIRDKDFRNVAEPMTKGWAFPTPGPTQPCQYFLQQ